MPSFMLSNVMGPHVNYLAKHTKLGVLLYLMDDGEQIPYWFPKVSCSLKEIHDRQTGFYGFEVTIPDWLWNKRERAKPMGCI